MNAVSLPVERRKTSGLSNVWRWSLLLFPIVVAVGLFLVRQMETRALARRPLASYGVVPPFQLTNQHDRRFGSADLAGKIWIADFIFTSCRGPCPIVSTRMAELQKPLKDSDVHLISFTVDPATDTPPVLRLYAEKLKAREGRWDFLTGAKATLYDLSNKGFKLGVSEEGDQPGQPVHSTRFVLVDRAGIIRGYYDALAPDAVTKLLADTSHLLREQPR